MSLPIITVSPTRRVRINMISSLLLQPSDSLLARRQWNHCPPTSSPKIPHSRSRVGQGVFFGDRDFPEYREHPHRDAQIVTSDSQLHLRACVERFSQRAS